jgi:glycosyltransferase involved in cell wall biosynthesis
VLRCEPGHDGSVRWELRKVKAMHRACVIAPSFNNSGTLVDVLNRILRLDLPAIVIDDGSADETPDLLRTLSNAQPRLTVRTHECNRGKAEALRTGFGAAMAEGFTHAITIDTDGQLDPEEIPMLLDLSRDNPDALIVGARDERKVDYPWRSRFGRRFSNLMVLLESGARVDDTQCGLRVYPLRLFEVTSCRTSRFAFETEIITRAAWAGFSVISVPVTCRYFEPERRVTHFRPFADSVHALLLHAKLLAIALLPWRRRNLQNDSGRT